MNSFLKAVIKEAFDAEALVADVVAKAWSKIVSDAISAGSDAAAIAANLSSAKSDLQALISNPAADADLVAYVVSLSAGIGSAKAQAVIAASAKLVLDVIVDGEALVVAIKS